jgi:hypothetical protein
VTAAPYAGAAKIPVGPEPIFSRKKGEKPEVIATYDTEFRACLDRKITDWARGFMKRSKDDGKPFHAYLPYTQVHIPPIPDPEYASKTRHGSWADILTQMDDFTRKILDALDELGLAEDTIVVWASDNGADSTHRMPPSDPDWMAMRSSRPRLPADAEIRLSVQVDQDEVLEQDHHKPERRRDGCGKEQMPAVQLRSSSAQPSVDRQQDQRYDQPHVGGREGRGPGHPGQHQGDQRSVGRGDHRPGRRQGFPDGCPARQPAPFNLLAQNLGILLGDPVHQQRHDDRDDQRRGGHVAPSGVEDRRGDDGAVYAGRAPPPEVLRGRPPPDFAARRAR